MALQRTKFSEQETLDNSTKMISYRVNNTHSSANSINHYFVQVSSVQIRVALKIPGILGLSIKPRSFLRLGRITFIMTSRSHIMDSIKQEDDFLDKAG